jgi:hypothetical protein
MRHRLSTLLKKVFRRNRWTQTELHSAGAATPSETPALSLFSPEGNCLACFNYRSRRAGAQDVPGFCSIRGFDIQEPLATVCKNFDSQNAPPFGAIYSIVTARDGAAIPWTGLAVPRVAAATCCVCGTRSETGIRLELVDDNVECCGPQHYLDWWTDYLSRRLEYFKQLGEKAYSDMYDVISPSAATASYSDAKEAFYSAISTARDLELAGEQQRLQERLAHIKAVFRSQFS